MEGGAIETEVQVLCAIEKRVTEYYRLSVYRGDRGAVETESDRAL
jgi:hypothetical protein